MTKQVCSIAMVLVILSGLLVGCGPAPTPQIVEVEKQVVVEKPVVQTVIVEKQVPVTKEVIKEVTKEVVKEVRVEKSVVTVAYNNYFNMTFGPAGTPFEELKKAVAAKYPNIEVRLNVMPYEAGPWHDNYVTWFVAKDGTTDLLGVGAYWTAEFAAAGWLLPLNNIIDPKILSQLNPQYMKAHTYKGDLIGLGPWWGGIGGLYYRKDLLAEVGAQPPKTYDDVVATAKLVMAKHPEMTGWTWPALNDWVLVNRWVEYLGGFGGTYFDAANKCSMTSPEGTAALKFMVGLIDQGISPKEVTTWKEEDSGVRFASGTAVFHTGRQDMMFWLDDPKKSQIGGKWGFIPNPAQPNGKSTGYYEGWAFSINKYSKQPEAAAKVLEVMFDFPMQKAFNLSQGPIQANMNVYKDPDVIKNNPNMPLIQAVADTATPPIPTPLYSEMANILAEELHGALTKIKTPDQALASACKRIDSIKQ